MEFLRAGEALLPFLVPSAHLVRVPRSAVTNATTAATSRQWRAQHQSRSLFQSKQTVRTFTLSQAARQADEPPPPPSRYQNEQLNNISDIRSLLDSTLDGTKGTPVTDSSRRSRITSRSAQRARDPLSSSDQDPPLTTSLDDFLRNLPQNTGKSMHNPFARAPSIPRAPAPLDPPKTKLGVSVGRTAHVSDSVDAARAFRNLDVKCRHNKIQAEFHRQRFHERPGLKRKRLRRQRWRKRFKEEFVNTVNMVKRLKAQGW